MPASRKVLLLLSQHTQSNEPFRLLNRASDLTFSVCYCFPHGDHPGSSEEFINKKVFSSSPHPTVRSVVLPNYAPKPGLSSFWGLINPTVMYQIAQHDIVVVFGHAYFTLLLAIFGSLLLRKPLFLSNDATQLRTTLRVKGTLKIGALRLLYNSLACGVLVPSTRARKFMESIGILPSKIFLTPYVVDNDKILELSRSGIDHRDRLSLSEKSAVTLFCGKLIERKGCEDLIRAFISANVPESVLLIIGDGPLRSSLEAVAASTPPSTRIIFCGLSAYEDLPAWYRTADLVVVPSHEEPYGLVVNEALVCERPVVASSAVGSVDDLIENEKNGLSYPAGDIPALTIILKRLLNDRPLLRTWGKHGGARMKSWSPAENAHALIEALSAQQSSKRRNGVNTHS